MTKYKRVILKLSGEAFSSSTEPISFKSLSYIVDEILKLKKQKVQLGIVVGAGNIWRGSKQTKISRVTADYIGMLSTVLNALSLKDVLEKNNIPSVVLSAIEISKVVETYVHSKTLEYLNNNKVVIFCAGTGNPYFTTDTTSALRAIELKSDVLLKATQVDGVYTSDPLIDKKAIKYASISFEEAIKNKLRIMDITAFTLCMENKLEIVVFDFYKPGNLSKILGGQKIGTVIKNE